MTTLHDDATILVDHPIGPRGRLAVRLASVELRIAGGGGDRVTVRTPRGRRLPDRVVLETVDGALTIHEKEILGVFVGGGERTVEMEIEVPAEAEIAIDTASGSVEATGLRGEQRYRTASGDLHLIEVAGRIDLNAVSGDAKLELAGAADLGIRTVSGDVSVSGGSLDGARVSTTSGDVRLDSPLTGRTGNTIETLSGDVSVRANDGIRVEARTVSGDLSSDLPHRTEGRMGRRTLIVGDGSIDLSFRSVSGDLRILGGVPADDASSRSSARPDLSARPSMPARPAGPPLRSLPPLPPLPGAFAGEPTASHVDPPADDPVASRDATTPADDERLEILRALEAGDLDVATAMDRLAELDAREAGEGSHV
jgi:putative adhesin